MDQLYTYSFFQKYIVCKGFLGLDPLYLQKLYICVNSFKFLTQNGNHIHQLFEYNFNKKFCKQDFKIRYNFAYCWGRKKHISTSIITSDF